MWVATTTEKERNPSPLTKRYIEKKLKSKYKMKCYLPCFHQLSDQQRHCSEAMILN